MSPEVRHGGRQDSRTATPLCTAWFRLEERRSPLELKEVTERASGTSTCPAKKLTRPMRKAVSSGKGQGDIANPTERHGDPNPIAQKPDHLTGYTRPNQTRRASRGRINPLAQSCTPFHSLGTHSDAPPGSSWRPNPAATNNAITTGQPVPRPSVRSARIDGLLRLGPEFMGPRWRKKSGGQTPLGMPSFNEPNQLFN